MTDWRHVLLLALTYSGVAALLLRYARLAKGASWKLFQVAEAAQADAPAAVTIRGQLLLPLLVYGFCCIVAVVFTSGHPLSMLADNGLLLLTATAMFDGSIVCALTAFAAFTLVVSPFQGVCIGIPVFWSAYKSVCMRKRPVIQLTQQDLLQLQQESKNGISAAAAAQAAATVMDPSRSTFRSSVVKFLGYSFLCAVFILVAEISRSDLIWLRPVPSHLPALSAGVRAAESFAAAILMPLRQGRVFEAAVAALLHMRPASVDAASLAPELSLMWYVGSAAFSRHLPYYAAIFAGHALLYPLPATYRLRRRPDLALVLVAGLAALLDPTSRWSLARLPLIACMALSHSAVIARMTRGSPHVWLGVLAAAIVAAPALKHAWLVALTSNANVLFNMALAVTVAGGSLLAEFAAAALRAQKVQARLEAWAESRRAKAAGAAGEAAGVVDAATG